MGSSTDKLLTIIVPTYNRRESLAKGLEALIPQVARHNDLVSLYVSDNCSDDGTLETINMFQTRYPSLIEYKRQTCNLGAHGNFMDAVKSVNSKYVVLFSDDDVAFPNYLDYILDLLRKFPDVCLIHCNVLGVSSEGEYCCVNNPKVTFGHPVYYPIGGDFIIEHTYVPSLISSNVFLSEGFVDELEVIKQDDYPGYAWFAALLKSILRKPCLYIDTPLIIQNRPAHVRWERDAAWYFAYGLSHLFSDLDKEHNGILKAWGYAFTHAWHQRSSLAIIGKYQEDYRDRYETMMKYSVSDEFSRLLKYYVFHSARYRRIRLNLLPRIARRLGLGRLLDV